MRRSAAVVMSLTLALGVPSPASAYLKFGVRVGGQVVAPTWQSLPVRYFVNDRSVPGVSAAQLQTALAQSFGTWQDVPTATITFQFAGFTSAPPFTFEGQNTVGFQSRPELERTLAATRFLVNTLTGALVESDIFFNETFPWSVAASGEEGRFDFQSVATHEIGHLLGLSHSAIGETTLQPAGGRRVTAAEAVMFPIAFSPGVVHDRTLKADDVAGVSDLYPDGDFRQRTGSISGRVTKNGQGIFGAHVVAFNPRTGALVGNFTLDGDGEFVIAGLDPGPHVVRVEPLDDGDIGSFFTGAIVDVDFRVTFLERLAIVPRGGAARVQIAVVPK